MDTSTLLLIGRNQARRAAAICKLDARYQVLTAPNGKQALARANEHPVDAIVLDLVSMRTPGERIISQLRQQLPALPLVVIGDTISASPLITVLLESPVTPDELLTCVASLMQPTAGDVLTCGPLALDTQRRVLLTNGSEKRLNPKQALLLELFMRQPGQTIDRKTIMEKVWFTDYIGDTRTLEVHIRWIRQAIEQLPSKPRFLKTVRGVGYRLEVPTERHSN